MPSEKTDIVSTNTRSKTISNESFPRTISTRKQKHIDVCMDEELYFVEGNHTSGFSQVHFIHSAFPEMKFDDISTEIKFLGTTIRLPLFISCMTGGSDDGFNANRELAKAAQSCGIPIGLGSIRVLFDHPERIDDFSIKSCAPDVPVLANLGAVQIRDIDIKKIKALVKKLEADALVVHLNCGQELFQEGGDRDFRGLFDAIGRAVETMNLPIIVKETGFGIRPRDVKRLIDLGVAYVDLAGAGGTNWILVEQGCQGDDQAAEEFSSWGLATAMLTDASRDISDRILASGGLRNGMDLAKSLALGAYAGGMALPFIRAALETRADGVCLEIENIQKVLQSVMFLTGSRTIEELRQAPLIKSPEFQNYVDTLKQTDRIR